MGATLKPVIRYSVVGNVATKRIQDLTIRTVGITLTGMYISPNSKEDEKLPILEKIRKHSRGRAIITGDLNARHKSKVTKSNSRARRLYKWANDNQWNISAPKNSTLAIRGVSVSTPDVALRKAVDVEGVATPPVGELKWNDHPLNYLHVKLGTNDYKVPGIIPKHQRENPK